MLSVSVGALMSPSASPKETARAKGQFPKRTRSDAHVFGVGPFGLFGVAAGAIAVRATQLRAEGQRDSNKRDQQNSSRPNGRTFWGRGQRQRHFGRRETWGQDWDKGGSQENGGSRNSRSEWTATRFGTRQKRQGSPANRNTFGSTPREELEATETFDELLSDEEGWQPSSSNSSRSWNSYGGEAMRDQDEAQWKKEEMWYLKQERIIKNNTYVPADPDGPASREVQDFAQQLWELAMSERSKFLPSVGVRPKVRYEWQLPQAIGPEVLFVGRSNAGKSSMLNALLAQHGHPPAAVSSSTAGRTRTLNWHTFKFNASVGWTKEGQRISTNKELPAQTSGTERTEEDAAGETTALLEAFGHGACLVDCFGLGEVEYSLKAKRLQSWAPLLGSYIEKRRSLVGIFHLVSAEQKGTLSEGDEQILLTMARSARQRHVNNLRPVSYFTVITKTDLCGPDEVDRMKAVLVAEMRKRGLTNLKVLSGSAINVFSGGIAEVDSALDGVIERGWGLQAEWFEEAVPPPVNRVPAPRTLSERMAVRDAFTRARMSGTRPSRGGAGSKTILIPSV